MPAFRQPAAEIEQRPAKLTTPVAISETPDQYSMGIKPPPVTFDMIEDLGRVCASIQVMAELGGRKADEQTLRRLARLVMIERELRQIIHADILHKRQVLNGEHDAGALFPHYRDFHDCRLIVQDLQAVWDGEKWTGDGACTFNKKFLEVTDSQWYGKQVKAYQYKEGSWPRRSLIMHTSMSSYQVGERTESGRVFIPHSQWFTFFDLKSGDYITGELYVEIC